MNDFSKILDKAKELESKMKESQEKIKNISVIDHNEIKLNIAKLKVLLKQKLDIAEVPVQLQIIKKYVLEKQIMLKLLKLILMKKLYLTKKS